MTLTSTLLQVLITLYNVVLLVMLATTAGGKILTLFKQALPLCLTYLLFYTWLPLLLLLLVLFVCLLIVKMFRRPSFSLAIASSSMLVLVAAHVLMVGVVWWSVSSACSSCHYSHLPPRPSLTAHRGCSMNFPENSLTAFEQASLIPSVRTLETDVQVSADGELFLLHDPHLSRTANIHTACPHLNPLHTASLLSYHTGPCPIATVPIKQDSYQRVPLFREYLEVAVANNKNVLFDLYRPISGHAYQQQYVAMTIDALVESKLDLSKVWIHTYRCLHSECLILKVWWLSTKETSSMEHAVPAGVTRVGVTKITDPDQFRLLGMSIANEEWTLPLNTLRFVSRLLRHDTPLFLFNRNLQQQNISINMYTINSLVLFDYAWCTGVNSVTTDNCLLMDKHEHNILHQVSSILLKKYYLCLFSHQACHSMLILPWSLVLLASLFLLTNLILLCDLPPPLRTKSD